SEAVDLIGWNEHEAPTIDDRGLAGAIQHEVPVQHIERLGLAVTVRGVPESGRLGGLAACPSAAGLGGVGLAHDRRTAKRDRPALAAAMDDHLARSAIA